jgi:hypothetical protein
VRRVGVVALVVGLGVALSISVAAVTAAAPGAVSSSGTLAATKISIETFAPGQLGLGSPFQIDVLLSPSTAVGTVSLYDGSSLLAGADHAVRAWVYSDPSFPAGTHDLSATFTPDDAGLYAASTATSVTTTGGDPTPPATIPPTTPTSGCSLSGDLVPSCGVLFGGTFMSFGGTTTQQSFNNFNAQSGSKASVDHDYLRPGQTLSAADVAVAQQPNTLLLANWKPTWTWADATGGNATVNAQIDAMAASVKALGATKIMMTLFHEPENDVTGSAAGCPATMTYIGSGGTPAQYRAMWANVESRFAADGVSNVVWVMNYMGYSRWNCMVNDLWPGNNLVDWVLWDPYMSTSLSFNQSVGSFYNELTTLSDANHDYLSKPWGLGEFGDDSTSNANQEQFYSTVAQSLDANPFPRLKLLALFDHGGCRVGYDEAGHYDQAELDDLTTLSQDPAIVAGRASVAGGLQAQ